MNPTLDINVSCFVGCLNELVLQVTK